MPSHDSMLTSIHLLPVEIILEIVTYLYTARDVSHLVAVSKRLYSLSQSIWRIFVITCFTPTLSIPRSASAFAAHNGSLDESMSLDYAALASRLTLHDRCWERRSFAHTSYTFVPLTELGEEINAIANRTRRDSKKGGQTRPKNKWARSAAGGQTMPARPCLDAALIGGDFYQELLVFNTGEDLYGRIRHDDLRGVTKNDTWLRDDGNSKGYVAGVGDITAASIVEDQNHAHSGVIVGRANGDLNLVSASPQSFGRPLTSFEPATIDDSLKAMSSLANSKLRTIICTDYQPNSSLLAVGNASSVVSLYSIKDAFNVADSKEEISCLSNLQAASSRLGLPESGILRSAKFINSDSLVCAFGSTINPIRLIRVTPSGPVITPVARNRSFLSSLDLETDNKTTVRAVQPLAKPGRVLAPGNSTSTAFGNGNESLILSAWNDGTCRLLDVRSPSAHDAVYRDEVSPNEAMAALLVCGMQRFITVDVHGDRVRIFDFRMSRSYTHTAALPCSTKRPSHHLGPRWVPTWPHDAPSTCDPLAAPAFMTAYKFPLSPYIPIRRPESTSPFTLIWPTALPHQVSQSGGVRHCNWHGLSARDFYRPDFNLRPETLAHPYALARASDISPSFYYARANGIEEFTLGRSHVPTSPFESPAQTDTSDQQLAAPSVNGLEVCHHDSIKMAEIGIGLCDKSDVNPRRFVPQTVILQRQTGLQNPQGNDPSVPNLIDADDFKRLRLDPGYGIWP